ncbi:MAG: metal-sensitive transcriptional regulator [Thermostichales cyanobacterium SZTDM-1c_bins_54]
MDPEVPPLPSRAQPHFHDPLSQQKLLNRLARIEGHVRGIKAMISEGTSCPDVLLQIAAVRGALEKVARLILEDHIRHCLAHAAQDPQQMHIELEELCRALDRYLD